MAETFEKEHREIIAALFEGGNSHVENYFILSEYESRGKKYKEYLITRDGFTLLVMGFTGEKAMRFKLDYIRQFNAMEKALIGKIKEREKGIAVRQALTNALQLSQENERMHGHAYSTYTNIIYKAVFKKNASQLREEYGATKKDNLRDYFSAEELSAVQSIEMIIGGLINCGWGYEQIRDFILNKNMKLIAA